MEAPERIYIVNDDVNIKREWYKTKQVGFETTEYTRTDAFIEKACDLLVDCIEDFMSRRMEIWGEESKKQTLENLRKAMKGE